MPGRSSGALEHRDDPGTVLGTDADDRFAEARAEVDPPARGRKHLLARRRDPDDELGVDRDRARRFLGPDAVGLRGLALPPQVPNGPDVTRPDALDAQTGPVAGDLLEHGHLIDRLPVRRLV